MLIQCTKKLLDELKITPTMNIEMEPIYSWHANIIKINRRKTIVLTNDSNLYPIVLHGVKAKELKDIGKHIISAIRETFLDESIKEKAIEQYISTSEEIVFAKTKNRQYVGKLNRVCMDVGYFEEFINTDAINQSKLNRRLAALLQKGAEQDYIVPYEVLFEDLETLVNTPIFSINAIEIKVELKLENHNVWRRLLIPHEITFQKLHNIIQIAFGWGNYHMYEFIIYSGKMPIAKMVQNEEELHYPSEIGKFLSSEVKVSEYLPNFKRMLYTYDFGDNWQHIIKVEDFKFGYNKCHSICLSGEGDTPPEDIGGESALDDLLNIVNNPNFYVHSEISNMVSMLNNSKFDLVRINKQLKTYR